MPPSAPKEHYNYVLHSCPESTHERHKMPKTLPVLFASLLIFIAYTRASDNQEWLNKEKFALGLKYTGLTYHPGGGENEEPYPRSLDSKDYWVVQVGLQMDEDYLLHKYLYLRSSVSLYRDCADVWAGIFHFGFRANYDFPFRVSARVGIGPTLLWRQNWYHRVKGYTRDSFFGPAKEETFQSAFIWYGGDVELEWKVWEKLSLVYSVIPGYPEVILSNIGARYAF